ncbi:hypothetical protein BDR26DRAFT_865475 [Obelidium mucronatum]|nr:hypothetical protein BDR26DRAFT_865475 [Obelidium mucronatum]
MPFSLQVAATILAGMAFESSLRGLFVSIHKSWKGGAWLYKIMLANNVICLISVPTLLWNTLATIEYCSLSSTLASIATHALFVSFGAFLLFKTWVISFKNKSIACISCLLLINRIVWWIYDSILSSRIILDDNLTCVENQNQFALLACIVSDLAIDLFSSVATIFFTICRGTAVFGNSRAMVCLRRVFVADNVVRSLFISALNIMALWYTINGPLSVSTSQQSLAFVVFPLFQNYVYIQAVNIEFWWLEQRTKAVQRDENNSASLDSDEEE